MTPIANNEAGSSVRSKLNTMMLYSIDSAVTKPADEARTSASLVADPDMTLPIVSGQNHLLHYCFLWVPSGVGIGITWTWTVPFTGNVQWIEKHIANGSTTIQVLHTDSGLIPASVPTSIAGVNVCEGFLRFTASASTTVAMKWGNATGAGNTIMKIGSWMQLAPCRYAV